VLSSATPVQPNRGILANLLAPPGRSLLVGFRLRLFRKRSSLLGGGSKRKPVDPETVRVTFDDVAGIDEVENEIGEVVDDLRDPDKYRRVRPRARKGVLLAGLLAPARPCTPGRPPARRGAVLLRQRLGVHRDGRRCRGQPGA
jgi:hypothetical protein